MRDRRSHLKNTKKVNKKVCLFVQVCVTHSLFYLSSADMSAEDFAGMFALFCWYTQSFSQFFIFYIKILLS